MIQINQNGRRFAFERDIINLFPRLCGGAGLGLAKHRMPPALRAFAEFTGATNEDLCRACTAMAEFVNLCQGMRYGEGDIAAAYVDSGLAAVPQPAVLALYAAIGMTTANAYFSHVRSAVPVDQRKPGDDEMSRLFDQAAHALRAPAPSTGQRRVDDLAARNESFQKEMSQR